MSTQLLAVTRRSAAPAIAFVIAITAVLLSGENLSQAAPEAATEGRELRAGSRQVASTGSEQGRIDAQVLEAGKPVEREIGSSDAHSYHVLLAANQYLRLEVEQRNINVVLLLFGPDGKELSETDEAIGRQGTEVLEFISDVSGKHRIEVRAAERNAAPGQYEAKILALRAPTAEERALEEARRLAQESGSLRHQGKYDEALPLSQRALALRERVLGPDHPTVAESLHLLAVIYDDKHDYVKAEPLNLRALAIREKALGPDHPDVARSLFNLAWIVKVKQDFAKAESLYRRALAIQERALGPDHTEVATTLNDLALLYNHTGDHDQSIIINRRVLAIREKALGPEDSGVAKALSNLARAYERKGDYTQAELLLTRALPIWEKALGAEHPDVAFALNNLANIYAQKGDYDKAEPLYERALAIRERALGPDHPEVATILNNLAVLYKHKGDYAKARQLLLRDLAITEKALGPDHRFIAPTLSNLAGIYQLEGDYARAEPLFRRALSVLEKALGPHHQDIGWSLYLLGRLCVEDKRSSEAQAQSYLERSLATIERAVGRNHHRVAAPLSGLGALSERRREWAMAEVFYRRALAIQEEALGTDTPEVAQTLANLARVYQAQGDAERALTSLSRSHEMRERHLNHNLARGSERQKLDYLRLFAEDTDRAITLHSRLAPRDRRALRLALTTLLRRKGRALDAARDSIATLRSRAAAEDRELFDHLSSARSQYAALTLRGPGSADAATYRTRLRHLEGELDRLEIEISARSAEFRAESRPITLDAVKAAIPEGSVLIEFALYRPRDAGAAGHLAPRFAAYLLAPDREPQWIDLGEAAIIDRTVRAWRRALRDPQHAGAKRLARALDARVMQPVRALLGGSKHLLISPDGSLYLVPFAALLDERGSYLAERYTITYLTSGRDLVRLQVARESRGGPVVIADPAFGEPALIASPGESSSRTGRNPRRAGGRVQVDYSQIFFGPLPGVGDEVRVLKELLPEAAFLVKEAATEAALKRLSGPRILHVATHGFFLQDGRDTTASGAASAAGWRPGKWAAQVENPLLRSGLALTGANQASQTIRDGDDGVLTALEAAGLDLWGTRLVVLSACDTGVGEVKNGDGVYGLRRALALAGAESQLMSLWPVSDRSTRDLMADYYKRLLQGEDRGEALRQAQLQLLRDKSRAHPYYWASFIQSGEWASMEAKRSR